MKYIIVCIVIAVIAVLFFYAVNNKAAKADTEKAVSSLKSALDDRRESFNAQAPESVKTAYEKGIQSVAEKGVIEQAKQLGDIAPDFTLTNASGESVRLSDYLKKGPVVLTWYRGGWCPYCNLTLRALQDELPAFKAAGANLLALTPELPDKSLSTSEKNELEFDVLSDIGNKVAREYGIVFKLTDEVAEIYADKFDMASYNGDDSDELPLTATYVIDQNGKIIFAFLDIDYRNRAEPSAISAALKKIYKII